MGKLIRKNIVVIVILIDIAIGYLLFTNRSFSHLAIWKILESNQKEDFYWEPEMAPPYFYFQKTDDRLKQFSRGIFPLIKDEGDESRVVFKIAQHIMKINNESAQSQLLLKWDSPEGMLEQIKKGAYGNCFHRAVLLSSYLAGIGIKSRLWALENENFDGTAHTVNEVYIKALKKWIFIDTMLGFYVTENGIPLSFIELREKLLSGNKKKLIAYNIDTGIERKDGIPDCYVRLVKLVFLRTGNNFIDKYNSRYGALFIFRKYIDRFPDRVRRGIDYFLGRQDIFIHYTDKFSKVLKYNIIAVKLFYYFFIISIGLLFVYMCFAVKLMIRRRS